MSNENKCYMKGTDLSLIWQISLEEIATAGGVNSRVRGSQYPN